jgi:hypothetical protein
MSDHPGLDDNSAFAAEQTAAAERGTASPERRLAVPRATPLSRRQTGILRRAQDVADEAPAAALIADAPKQDFELVIVAAHTCCPPSGSERLVPERGLKTLIFRLAKSQAISMAWLSSGGASFILP